MITAKLIIAITEEWFDSVPIPGGKGRVDVYENPSSSDIRELYQKSQTPSKFVRYITDARSSKVYVWDANLAIHDTIRQALNLGRSGPNSLIQTPYVLEGFGKISGGTIVSETKDMGGHIHRLKSDIQFIKDWKSKHILNGDVVRNFFVNIRDIRKKFSNISTSKWSFLGRFIHGEDTELEKVQQDYDAIISQLESYL